MSYNFSFGQSYKDAFRDDVCVCLKQEKLKLRLTEKTYDKCFKEILPKYATKIDGEIKEEDVNKKYRLGQKARTNLMLAYKHELIYTCDVYYNLIEELRTGKKLIARENAKKSDLKLLNEQVAMSPNYTSYSRRAQLQFKLGDLEASVNDINRGIEVHPYGDNVNYIRNDLLLLAWIYEEQGRFNDAIKLYDTIYTSIYDTDVAVLRSIVDKKSGGTLSNISLSDSKNKTIKISKENSVKTNGKRILKSSRDKNNRRESDMKKKDDTSSLRKLFKIDQ